MIVSAGLEVDRGSSGISWSSVDSLIHVFHTRTQVINGNDSDLPSRNAETIARDPGAKGTASGNDTPGNHPSKQEATESTLSLLPTILLVMGRRPATQAGTPSHNHNLKSTASNIQSSTTTGNGPVLFKFKLF